MNCIVVGIKPREYDRKDGTHVKGVELNMLAENAEVYGKTFKDCFISCDSPVYMNNYATFQDMDALKGREVNVEWDVETYGTKTVKKLVGFEFKTDFYDIIKREKAVK